MLFQLLVVPFSCLLHLPHINTTPAIQVVPRSEGLIKPEDNWPAIKAWESKPLFQCPAMTLRCPGAPAAGLGQWKLQRQQHQHDKGNSHSPLWWARQGKAKEKPAPAFMCLCRCFCPGWMSEKWEGIPDEAFFSSLLTTAPSVLGQEALNVKQQFSALTVAGIWESINWKSTWSITK